MNNIKMFEGHEVEVFELNGRVLFNSKHVGKCLDLSESAVRNYLAQMNQKQAIIAWLFFRQTARMLCGLR